MSDPSVEAVPAEPEEPQDEGDLPAVDAPADAPLDEAAPPPGETVPQDELTSVPPADRFAAIRTLLRDEPESFSFFQAVRILERLYPDKAPVGGFADPGREVVRFGVPARLAFPPSEIDSLELDDDEPSAMGVNFMGLTGPLGVLPHVYTWHLEERLRARDPAPADFLDLFNHRLISLFYRAWRKYRFTISRENGDGDRLMDYVLDLVGLGVEGYRRLLPFPDGALVFRAGLLAIQTRGAVALEQLVEDFLDVPATVEQFIGGWYGLTRPDRCGLDDEEDPANRLGLGAVAGDEIFDPQARVRVRIGPLPRERFEQLLPTGEAHEPLKGLLRFYSDDRFEFEIQLVLERDEVPGFVLGAEEPQPLGWSTWIRTRRPEHDAEDTVLTI